jgi:hypothetical protein
VCRCIPFLLAAVSTQAMASMPTGPGEAVVERYTMQ